MKERRNKKVKSSGVRHGAESRSAEEYLVRLHVPGHRRQRQSVQITTQGETDVCVRERERQVFDCACVCTYVCLLIYQTIVSPEVYEISLYGRLQN